MIRRRVRWAVAYGAAAFGIFAASPVVASAVRDDGRGRGTDESGEICDVLVGRNEGR